MAEQNAHPISFHLLSEAPRASDRALRYRDCEKAGSSEYLCFAFRKPISQSFGRAAADRSRKEGLDDAFKC